MGSTCIFHCICVDPGRSMAIVYTPNGRCRTTGAGPIYAPLIKTDVWASPVCISTVRPWTDGVEPDRAMSAGMVGMGGVGRVASRGGGSDGRGNTAGGSGTSVEGKRGRGGGVVAGASEAGSRNRVSVAPGVLAAAL